MARDAGADFSRWIQADAQAALDARATKASASAAQVPTGLLSTATLPPLVFINTSNWDNEPVPDREWGVPGRFPLRQTALIYGEGGGGKSYTTLHLTAAHTLGREWLGSHPAQGPAIFIDAEDDEKEIHIRLNSIVRHFGVTHTDLIKGGHHIMSRVGQDSILATFSRNGTIEPTPFYNQLLQAAGDIKPKLIGIASLSDIFAGSEIDRSQVQRFISLTTRLARVAGGYVLLVAHPSLTGISTGTGLSGTTQWHNSVRARAYLRSAAPVDGEQPDSDLRELEFKKVQYDAMPDTVVLRYQNGMFLPVEGVTSLDKEAQLETAKKVFLELLGRYELSNRTVSEKTGTNFAPAKFAKEGEAKAAGVSAKILNIAMLKLFEERKIWMESIGKPSRPAYKVALAPKVHQQANKIPEHDTILRWAQACVVGGAVTGGNMMNAWAYLAIGQPITSELIYESYKKYCKKSNLPPEEEAAFNNACEGMFGPSKQIPSRDCINYTKKPTNYSGYDVPGPSKWQQIIVERINKGTNK